MAAAAKQHVKQRSAAAMKGQVALSNPLSSGRGGGKNRFFKRRVVKKAFYSDEEDESGEEMVGQSRVGHGMLSICLHVPFFLSSKFENNLRPHLDVSAFGFTLLVVLFAIYLL